jgi:hypothetical protein
MLTERPDVEGTKRKNIIDTAVAFTAMTRIFSVRSKARIVLSLPAASSVAGFSAPAEGVPTAPGQLMTPAPTRLDTVYPCRVVYGFPELSL